MVCTHLRSGGSQLTVCTFLAVERRLAGDPGSVSLTRSVDQCSQHSSVGVSRCVNGCVVWIFGRGSAPVR
jgi:hypothetical protein